MRTAGLVRLPAIRLAFVIALLAVPALVPGTAGAASDPQAGEPRGQRAEAVVEQDAVAPPDDPSAQLDGPGTVGLAGGVLLLAGAAVAARSRQLRGPHHPHHRWR